MEADTYCIPVFYSHTQTISDNITFIVLESHLDILGQKSEFCLFFSLHISILTSSSGLHVLYLLLNFLLPETELYLTMPV